MPDGPLSSWAYIWDSMETLSLLLGPMGVFFVCGACLQEASRVLTHPRSWPSTLNSNFFLSRHDTLLRDASAMHDTAVHELLFASHACSRAHRETFSMNPSNQLHRLGSLHGSSFNFKAHAHIEVSSPLLGDDVSFSPPYPGQLEPLYSVSSCWPRTHFWHTSRS